MKITKEIENSIILKFSSLASEKTKRGEKIISMGFGEPLFATPGPILDATFNALKDGYTKYSNPFELPELRGLIKNKLLKENNYVGITTIFIPWQ